MLRQGLDGPDDGIREFFAIREIEIPLDDICELDDVERGLQAPHRFLRENLLAVPGIDVGRAKLASSQRLPILESQGAKPMNLHQWATKVNSDHSANEPGGLPFCVAVPGVEDHGLFFKILVAFRD